MKNKNMIGIGPMTLVIATLLIFMSTGVAMAIVWTDQADYSPGSIVTISGDKSDGAGYLAGETVNVSVNGPYQYDSKCSGTADENGVWSCQITLSADYTAEGSYIYTAVGQTSGVTQSGTFLDAASNVNFATSGLPSGVSVGVTYSGTNNGGHPISGTQTFASPGPSADIGTLTGSLFTYSFPTSINTGGITYSMVSSSPSSPFNTASGKTRVTATYVVVDNTPPVITPSVSGILGSNGWYISDVTVSWTVSDPESAITSSSGCGDTMISADTTGITLTCSATSTGGTSSQSVTIKRDATSPTVSASPDRYADHNGWYNSKVTISFTGTDASPGSGIDSCDPSVDYSLDSAAASVSGTCKDKAGNVGTGSFNFKYDGTSPTITASASPSPASTGWYNIATGIPTVSFTCSDATSGLTDPCPDSVTLGEGAGQSVSRTISDSAGNSASATVGGINIDLTEPTLSFGTATPEPNTAGWNNADVSVPFTPDDTLSGIAGTSLYSSLVLASEGYAVTGTVTVIDNAGNSETFTSPAFKIDKTKPTITGSRTPLPNANDWNNVDVTVHFACDDRLSGISSCTSDTIVSTEETGQSVTGTAIDQAGNTESVIVGDINIDKTSPTIIASASTSDGTYTSGTWTNKDVTVSFSCSDDRSGVASCDSSVTKSGEGAGQSVTGSVTDKAGNTASTTFSGINIDKTAPTITLNPSIDSCSLPGDAGWCRGTQTAGFDAKDELSGLADATKASFTQNTADNGATINIVSGQVCDVVGNCNPGINAGPYKIDSVAPTVVASPDRIADHNGWYNSPIKISFSGTDFVSGIASCDAVDYNAPDSATASVSGTCKDNAGNMGSGILNFKFDSTPPIATLDITSGSQGLNGWYTSTVVVSTTGSDSVSSPVTCTGVQSFTTETTGITVTGSCVNDAGLSTNAAPLTVKIDLGPPTITIATPTNGANYILNQVVTANYNCVDTISGVASCVGTVANGANIDTSSVGTKTFTVTSTDNAGDQGQQQYQYKVIYVFGGILQPINTDGSSIFKFGSTVPVKFQLKDYNGNYVSTAVATISMAKIDNNVEGTYIEAISTSAATTGNMFRYDLTSNQYIFNLATKPLSTGTWNIKISINDGTTYIVKISLR